MDYNNSTYPGNQDEESQPAADRNEMDVLKEKYGKVYRVALTLEPDDETEVELEYRFRKPKTVSYDRYVKTMSNSPTKSAKVFILDNVVQEDEDRLKRDMEEYPALCLGIIDKLMSTLGLSKATNLKVL